MFAPGKRQSKADLALIHRERGRSVLWSWNMRFDALTIDENLIAEHPGGYRLSALPIVKLQS